MSHTIPSLSIALIVALVGSAAYANTDSGTTRAQVRAQTMAAIRNGDVIEGNGLTARAMEPGMYPAAPAGAGATRAQVKAELAQAIRSGTMPAPGRITMTQRQEDFPQLYS